MEVIILAGGLGTRLRSVVSEVPKCMAPVAGKPFLWYLLKYLSRYEVSKVILSVGYLRDIIFKWIDEVKSEFSFDFEYAIESEPMGTGGGIRLAMERVTESEVIILNGDTFFDVNLNQFISEHKTSNSLLSIALKPMSNFDRYGNVLLDESSNHILAFQEKQRCSRGQINGGVYILNNTSELWGDLPAKFSFETEFLQNKTSEDTLISGFIYNGYFIDIGIPEDYSKASNDFIELFS